MARRPSKHLRTARPLLIAGQSSAEKASGRWITRQVPLGHSEKSYLCPYCQRPIPPGTAHLVAWPAQPPLGSTSGLDHRRHWHTACWARQP